LQRWQKTGGVMIIGYEMFRNLTGPNKNIRKGMKEVILECLVDPGADLVVCDEGHLLKNEDTSLSKCMRSVKTMRRIVLTGTPLQNNLIECKYFMKHIFAISFIIIIIILHLFNYIFRRSLYGAVRETQFIGYKERIFKQICKSNNKWSV